MAPGDPAALHEELAELIADPAARQQLSTTARAAAAGPYSWDRAAAATLELYRRLLATGVRASA